MRTEAYVERVFERSAAPTGNPPPGTMWIVCRGGLPTRAEFTCPCGCGQFLSYALSLGGPKEEGGIHYWGYSPGPTLSPSIRIEAGCRAHFQVTGGRVSWE